MFLDGTFPGPLLGRTRPAPKQADGVQVVHKERPEEPQARDAELHPRETPPGVHAQSKLPPGGTGAGATAAQQPTLLGFHVSPRFTRENKWSP